MEILLGDINAKEERKYFQTNKWECESTSG
jgi:hypothetical protein